MVKKDKELSKIVDIIVRNALPRRIFLFGSRAMGTARHGSDYDLFVLVKDNGNTRKIEKELYYLMAKNGVGVPVDLVVGSEDKFEKLKDNRYLVYGEVDKYGKTIYEEKTGQTKKTLRECSRMLPTWL